MAPRQFLVIVLTLAAVVGATRGEVAFTMPVPYELSIDDDPSEACRHPQHRPKIASENVSLCFGTLESIPNPNDHAVWRAMYTSISLDNDTQTLQLRIRKNNIMSPNASIKIGPRQPVLVMKISEFDDLLANLYNGDGVASDSVNNRSTVSFTGQLNKTAFEAIVFYHDVRRSHTIHCLHDNTLTGDFYLADSCRTCVLATFDSSFPPVQLGWRQNGIPLCNSTTQRSSARGKSDPANHTQDGDAHFPPTDDRITPQGSNTGHQIGGKDELNSKDPMVVANPPAHSVFQPVLNDKEENSRAQTSGSVREERSQDAETVFPAKQGMSPQTLRTNEAPVHGSLADMMVFGTQPVAKLSVNEFDPAVSSDKTEHLGLPEQRSVEPGNPNGRGENLRLALKRLLSKRSRRSSPELQRSESHSSAGEVHRAAAAGEHFNNNQLHMRRSTADTAASSKTKHFQSKTKLKAQPVLLQAPQNMEDHYSQDLQASVVKSKTRKRSVHPKFSHEGNSYHALNLKGIIGQALFSDKLPQFPFYNRLRRNTKRSTVQKTTREVHLNNNKPPKEKYQPHSDNSQMSEPSTDLHLSSAEHGKDLNPSTGNHSRDVPSLLADPSTRTSSPSEHGSDLNPLSASRHSQLPPSSASHHNQLPPLSASHHSQLPPSSASHHSQLPPSSASHHSELPPESAEPDRTARHDKFRSNGHKDFPHKETVSCSLHLVADHLFFNEMGDRNTAKTVNLMVSVVNGADAVFRAVDFNGDGVGDNIGFVVKNITIIQNSSAAPYSYSRTNDDSFQYLRSFSTGDFSDVCLGVAFTAIDFDRGVVGLAWYASSLNGDSGKGGICGERVYLNSEGSNFSFNTAIVTFMNHGSPVYLENAILTLVHEFGHCFGSSHDDMEGSSCNNRHKGGYYLMQTYRPSRDFPNNYKFSPCSLRQMYPVIVHKGSKCFTRYDGPTSCGNGVLEEGEECDCGLSGACMFNDHCCTPGDAPSSSLDPPCTFRRSQGMECSFVTSACCSKSCRHIGPEERYVCRAAADCYSQAVCDGKGALCPASSRHPDGTPCNGGVRVCTRGTCRDSVCVRAGLKDCFCKEREEDQCKLCCHRENQEQCLPARAFNITGPGGQELYLPEGEGCLDYRGVCKTEGQSNGGGDRGGHPMLSSCLTRSGGLDGEFSALLDAPHVPGEQAQGVSLNNPWMSVLVLPVLVGVVLVAIVCSYYGPGQRRHKRLDRPEQQRQDDDGGGGDSGGGGDAARWREVIEVARSRSQILQQRSDRVAKACDAICSKLELLQQRQLQHLRQHQRRFQQQNRMSSTRRLISRHSSLELLSNHSSLDSGACPLDDDDDAGADFIAHTTRFSSQGFSNNFALAYQSSPPVLFRPRLALKPSAGQSAQHRQSGQPRQSVQHTQLSPRQALPSICHQSVQQTQVPPRQEVHGNADIFPSCSSNQQQGNNFPTSSFHCKLHSPSSSGRFSGETNAGCCQRGFIDRFGSRKFRTSFCANNNTNDSADLRSFCVHNNTNNDSAELPVCSCAISLTTRRRTVGRRRTPHYDQPGYVEGVNVSRNTCEVCSTRRPRYEEPAGYFDGVSVSRTPCEVCGHASGGHEASSCHHNHSSLPQTVAYRQEQSDTSRPTLCKQQSDLWQGNLACHYQQHSSVPQTVVYRQSTPEESDTSRPTLCEQESDLWQGNLACHHQQHSNVPQTVVYRQPTPEQSDTSRPTLCEQQQEDRVCHQRHSSPTQTVYRQEQSDSRPTFCDQQDSLQGGNPTCHHLHSTCLPVCSRTFHPHSDVTEDGDAVQRDLDLIVSFVDQQCLDVSDPQDSIVHGQQYMSVSTHQDSNVHACQSAHQDSIVLTRQSDQDGCVHSSQSPHQDSIDHDQQYPSVSAQDSIVHALHSDDTGNHNCAHHTTKHRCGSPGHHTRANHTTHPPMPQDEEFFLSADCDQHLSAYQRPRFARSFLRGMGSSNRVQRPVHQDQGHGDSGHCVGRALNTVQQNEALDGHTANRRCRCHRHHHHHRHRLHRHHH